MGIPNRAPPPAPGRRLCWPWQGQAPHSPVRLLHTRGIDSGVLKSAPGTIPVTFDVVSG